MLQLRRFLDTSQSAAKGLVQKGFFQRIQCGEFALVDGFEELGFDGKLLHLLCNGMLLVKRRDRQNCLLH